MKCCVPSCLNSSEKNDSNVSFHMLPSDDALRSDWIKAINREPGWVPKKFTKICSAHFEPNAFYKTKKNLKKIRQGVIPVIITTTEMANKEYTDTKAIPVCRICLATDCKLYKIRKHKLENAFQTITGLSLQRDDKLPHKICIICARKLDNCFKFRDKILRADFLLNELVSRYDCLTLQNIKSIDRQTHKLSTNLTIKHFEPDHYDFNFEQTDITKSKLTTEIAEVKSESDDDDFVKENDDDFDDDDEKVKDETDDVVFSRQDDAFGDDEDKKNVVAEIVNAQDIIDAVIIVPAKREDSDSMEGDDNEDSSLNKDSYNDGLSPRTRSKVSVRKKPNPEAEALLRKMVNRKRQKKARKTKAGRRQQPFVKDTLFVVTHLTQEEQSADIEKRKESANYKNAIFRCTECFKGFLDGVAYTTHMVKHTKQNGEYRCDICKCHFKNKHRIRTHITAYHMQRYTCKECAYFTSNRQTARQHEQWHKGTKYKCPHCPDEFVKCTTYFGHLRIKHPSDFVCSLCGFSFVSEKGIELHKKLKHKFDNKEVPEDGPLCELCNVRFISTDALQQHIRVSTKHKTNNEGTRETNKRKYETRTKERERKLEIEGLLHLDVGEQRQLYLSQKRDAGPIPCEQCGQQLADSRAYHSHFRRMHPDKNRTNYPSMKTPCMCELCGKIFQNTAQLRNHRTVHTGEKPFKCDQCDKSFRVKHRLEMHKWTHSSEKPNFVCNLCGKNFSSASNKHRHMFIHTGLKPFKCEMCGKCFKNSTEKRAHITYVHLKKPWPKRNRGKRRSEGRQGMLPQQSASNSGSEMDIGPPLWPTEHIE